MSGVPRVCHLVSSFYPDIGGVQRSTLGVCRELVRHGVDVIVVTRRFPGMAPYEMVAGVSVYRPGLPSRGKFGALTFALHATALFATRLRGYKILHVQNIDTPLLVGFVCKVLLRRTLVATIHGEAKIGMKRASMLGRVRLALMRRMVTSFGALTDEMRSALLAEGIPRSRLELIENGIDTSLFRIPEAPERLEARRGLALAPDALVVLFVGRLVALKRVDVLLRAWKEVRPVRGALLVVGDGPERTNLEQLSIALRLTSVHFVGPVSEVRDYLWAADVFVLVSEREGLPVALLEAMAAGLPVVVSDLPGNRSVVHDGENGLLVPVGELECLVNRLSSVVASPALRKRLGSNARASIDRQYSLMRVSRLHEKLYAELALRRDGVRVEQLHQSMNAGPGKPVSDRRS